MYYAKILATDTDKLFSYLQSNIFVEHLLDKCFYNEFATAAIYIKKGKILELLFTVLSPPWIY